MKFLRQTRGEKLHLEANPEWIANWYVDAAFAVHPDYKSHTGAVMTLGNGAKVVICRKQRLNTESSTAGELVAADEAMGPLLWMA